MDLLFCWTTFLSCQKAFMIWHNRKLCISNTWHSFCNFQSQAVKNICTIRIKSGDNCRKGVSIREKGDSVSWMPLQHYTLRQNTTFCQKKNVSPQISLILKNFKFNVRVHFIKTEFLDKNCDFVTVCVLLPYFFIEKLVYVLTHFFGRKTEVWTIIELT